MTIQSPAVNALLLAGLHKLLACTHPRAKCAGATCTQCGAEHLQGTGWTLPTLLENMKNLYEAASKAEDSPTETHVFDHRVCTIKDCIRCKAIKEKTI